jgi:chorismate mutase
MGCIIGSTDSGQKENTEREKSMYCRGIRGATTVEHNDKDEILAATAELLRLMVLENDLLIQDIASASFTVTDDLDAVFPAQAARQIGWNEVALMCMREIPVPNSLSKCIRVLLLVNTTRSASEVQHVYIHEAAKLRPEFESEAK